MALFVTLRVCGAVVVLMAVITLVGRQLVAPLPFRLRARAKLYLAPAIGLALLVLVASLIGRFFGFAAVPGAVGAATLGAGFWALYYEPDKKRALAHAALTAVIALVAGSAILLSLLRYGGYNSYSDAFTYLVHGNWLQHHGFLDFIPPAQVEPYTTQIYLYQIDGFRMGGSYVLGWVQAAADMRWSYLAYPVTLSLAAGAFSLAVPFMVSTLYRVRRVDGYLLACLPALSPGAMTYSLVAGFLPQAFGLTMALTFMSLTGVLVAELTERPRALSRWTFWGISGVLGGLGAATVSCYSEISPLVAAATILAVAIILVLRPRSRVQVLQFLGSSTLIALVLLNWEVWRAIKALPIQMNGLVGWPVDWQSIDFLGFAFGLHGGSNDAVGWLLVNSWLSCAVLAALLIATAWAWYHPVRNNFAAILPLIFFGGLCVLGFAYFRYFVVSPFPAGKGQSWSEFKLANWIFAATAVLAIGALAALMQKWRQGLGVAVLLVLIGLGVSDDYLAARPRTAYVVADLRSNRPIFDTMLEFRTDVKRTAAGDDVVYLQTSGLQKLQQLIVYFLHDVHITSDWSDDYIGYHLPPEKRIGRPSTAKFIIEMSTGVPQALKSKELWDVGTLTMLPENAAAQYDQIAGTDGGYGRETGPNRWWYWVRKRIDFDIKNTGSPAAVGRRISFEYWLSPDRSLTLDVVGQHNHIAIDLPHPRAVQGSFEKVIPASFGPITQVILTGGGPEERLSQQDPRVIRFLVANLTIRILEANDAKCAYSCD